MIVKKKILKWINYMRCQCVLKNKNVCKRDAKYVAESIFGNVYYCNQHMMEGKKCLGIGRYKELKSN